MFQLQNTTEVHVASVTNRIEKHGDEDKPAVSLSLELTDANTSLDVIDPKIREALYKADDRQDPLPGVELSTPVLRCNAFERHSLSTKYEGWTRTVEDGVDEDAPMVFGGIKADKFTVEAKQGGSVVLVNPWPGKTLRIYKNGADAGTQAGTEPTISTAKGDVLAIAPDGTAYSDIVSKLAM